MIPKPTNRHTCDQPIEVVNPRYRSLSSAEDIRMAQTYSDYKIVVPCGHCLTCRQKRARSWHYRLYREALGTPTHHFTASDKNGKKTRYNNSPRVLFCTFTFNDKHLPKVPTNKEERDILAPYIRKWRDSWRKKFGTSPRYFAISDIGGEEGRLHLHLLIFNPTWKDGRRINISDIYSHNRNGNLKLPPSRQCLWRYGFCTYCSWIRGIEAIHYVSGYLTLENAMRQAEKGSKVLKHGKPLCREALIHYASVFCSMGIGRCFINTPLFEQLRATRSHIDTIGNFYYAIPRYYRLYYYEVKEYTFYHTDYYAWFHSLDFYNSPPPVHKCVSWILTREEQLVAANKKHFLSMVPPRPWFVDTPCGRYTNPDAYDSFCRKRVKMYTDPCYIFKRTSPVFNGDILGKLSKDTLSALEEFNQIFKTL